MKITHIVSSLESSQGGPPNSVLNMAEHQSKLGYKIKVVSKIKNLDKKKKIKLKGIEIIKGEFLFKKHYIPNFTFIIKIYKALKNSDIVHLHGIWNGVISISLLLCRLMKKKTILTPHGSLDYFNVKNRFYFKKFYYYLIEKYNLEYVHAYHFLTKKEFDNSCWINTLTKKKKLIQSNGIDIKYLKNIKINKKIPTDKNKINITYIGRLNKIKNIQIQIKLLFKLLTKDKNYVLNIIGPDDGELLKLKNLTKKLNLEGKVNFKAPIYSEQRFSWIKNSDIILLTSFYECNSVLAIETIALGGVLLCTNSCNLSDAAKFGAVKSSKNNLQNLIKSVNYLNNNKNSRNLREKALKYALKYLDIKINTKEILNLYKEVVKIN